MTKTKLSCSSFNLYNLNLPNKKIYTDKDGWSQKEYEKKIRWTREIITKLKSDIWSGNYPYSEDNATGLRIVRNR